MAPGGDSTWTVISERSSTGMNPTPTFPNSGIPIPSLTPRSITTRATGTFRYRTSRGGPTQDGTSCEVSQVATPVPVSATANPMNPLAMSVNEATKVPRAITTTATRWSSAHPMTPLYPSASPLNHWLKRSSIRVIHSFFSSGTCGSAQ